MFLILEVEKFEAGFHQKILKVTETILTMNVVTLLLNGLINNLKKDRCSISLIRLCTV